MRKIALWMAILSVVLSTAAFGADSQQMDAAATMAVSDKNDDKSIDREEYHQRMTEVFFFTDTDKDGDMTIVELQTITEIDPRRFETIDKDGNQRLSINEYLNALHKDFEVADEDQDGLLDMQELQFMLEN